MSMEALMTVSNPQKCSGVSRRAKNSGSWQCGGSLCDIMCLQTGRVGVTQVSGRLSSHGLAAIDRSVTAGSVTAVTYWYIKQTSRNAVRNDKTVAKPKQTAVDPRPSSCSIDCRWEATVDILAQTILFCPKMSPYYDKLDCWVFRTLGWHRGSSSGETCRVFYLLFLFCDGILSLCEIYAYVDFKIVTGQHFNCGRTIPLMSLWGKKKILMLKMNECCYQHPQTFSLISLFVEK